MTRTVWKMMVQRSAARTKAAGLCCGLLVTLPALPAGCAPAVESKAPPVSAVPQSAPVPLVGWSAVRAAGDSTVVPDVDVLQGAGSAPGLNQLHVVSSGDVRRINPALVAWARGSRGPAFLALAQPNGVAEANPVLQAGTDSSSLAALAGKPLTLFVEFRLTGSMSVTGNPRSEEDGVLISAGPGLSVFIAGRGRDGKTRRLASLRVKEKNAAGEESECAYTAQLEDELHLGQWYRLAFTWNGAQPAEKRVTAAINGASCPVTLKGNGLAAPVQVNPAGPLLIGGDRKWNNAPILLSSFAIYDRVLPAADLLKLNGAGLQNKTEAVPMAQPSQYETLAALNTPQAWQAPTTPLTAEAAKNGMLRVGLADSSATAPLDLRLKAAVALDPRVTSVNFWVCQPPRGKGALTLIPLFLDADGKDVEGPGQLFFSEHCQPPNSRKAGLWLYRFVDVPNGARKFAGFKIKTEDSGAPRKADPTDCVFIKDIGLERIDYARAPLYYVVGNYRDNFQDTHYNNMGARALTDASGGAALPYVLLDNLVDQAKEGRPKLLDVEMDAYDTADRHVWSGKLSDAAAADVPDLFRKITVPLTQPGTYRIRGKSYDSATGEYFTTDWTKLIVVKGKPQVLAPRPQSGLLEINAAKPFGRLEKNDPRQITFSFAAQKPGEGPLSLRYAVIPYDEAAPFWRAKREAELSQTRSLNGTTPVTVAYEPKRTVELVVAELWRGGKCIEHEERPIGIANSLDRAPAFTIANQVPTLKDLAGPGKVWKTITIVSNPGDDVFQALKRNIGEAKKLTPDIGFEVSTPRLVPIPGVYDWDLLKQYLDMAASENCRIMLYLNQKWPPEWAPVEWASDPSGQVHRTGTLYAYMVGKSVYATGLYGPEILRQFNQQLARRFLNHPGLGGYYFENEHLDIQWEKHPSSRSYHESFRQGFGRFLKARYGTIAKLNAAYGTAYTAFEQAQLPNSEDQGQFPKKVMFIDFRLFQKQEVENFVLRDQVDVARAEDPRRPIIVYGIGEETFDFLKHVQASGGIIANGGVHSSIFTDSEYERVTAVPGLCYRMEPHDVTNYDPIPHGFDEMIFGMLALGGRGMHAHVFLHGWETLDYQKAMQPGQRTGLDKLVGATPMMTELRDAEKLHDPIGILELRTQGSFEPGIWDFHAATYAFSHYNPLTVAPGGRLDYLDGCKLIAIGRNTIDAAQRAYLGKFLRAGGKVVMESTSGQYSLETPDAPVHNALLDSLGVNLFAEGAKLSGVDFGHDVYDVGKGQVLVARGGISAERWEAALPALIKWAGITGRLADSDDRFMQMHVLQRGESYYLATTHRGTNQGFPAGPNSWQGKVRFLQPLPGASYRVTEMMSGQTVGVFTPAQLAAGFDVGAYAELQMKLFKIAPA